MLRPRATPGGQRHYSDLAIETALTLRAVFGLALRQTEGLVGSIMQLLGIDLSRSRSRQRSAAGAGGLKVLQKPRASSDPLHLDHRQHRPEIALRCRRMAVRKAWNGKAARLAQLAHRHRCRHVGAGEIVASDPTDKGDVDDAFRNVGPMLDQLSLAPTSFIGDGAYDRGYRERASCKDEIPICPFSFRRAKASQGARIGRGCRRRPNAIGTFWKLRNGVECIGKASGL